MNNRLYWKIRKAFLNLKFRLKKNYYGIYSSLDAETSYLSFWSVVIKKTLLVIIRTSLVAIALLIAESLFTKVNLFNPVDNNMLLDALIGGIGVAGVILGLYCANISSIYSSKYSDAPESISFAFQNDKLTQRCIRSLIEYIVFGFIIITEILIGIALSWLTVIVIILWSITVIISYSLAGSRTYRLSDIYAVANDTHRALYKTVKKRLKSRFFASDANFQNHFCVTTDKQIRLLETVQRYASNSEKIGNSSLYDFMAQNLVLLDIYWEVKPTISKKSLWYKSEGKYQKWHLSSSTEVEMALNTGTPLTPKDEHDYLWFENRIFEINKACIKELINRRDYVTIYKYTLLLEQLIKNAIKANELGYFVNQINGICSHIETNIIANEEIEEKRTIAGIVEVISVLYLRLFINCSNSFKMLDLEKIDKLVISSIDSGVSIEQSPVLRGRRNHEFYEKITSEILTEGDRVTPEWVIKQAIAKEEYDNLNAALDAVIDGLNTVFTLGKKLSEEKRLFDACIILSRFYEYESKHIRFKTIMEQTIKDLESHHIDKEIEWENSRLSVLEECLFEWRKTIPDLLGKCAFSFAIETWDNRDEYPDFLGECYNHICMDAIDSIVNNSHDQFKSDFESLTRLMLLYQEYIRTDFVKKKDLYRIEYSYYMITYPIIEWAQIGGLAILWGEFFNEPQWNNTVNSLVSQIINDKKGNDIKLAEKLVEYAQNRERYILGIGSRSVLETSWNIRVAEAIKSTKEYETEDYFYGTRLKTDSNLLKAFCGSFPSYGFPSNTADVLFVTCINSKLPKEKRYHSISKWEEKLDDT